MRSFVPPLVRSFVHPSVEPSGAIELIVAKASHGQRYPMPLCECRWMCDGERGSGPEGPDDLCLVSFEH